MLPVHPRNSGSSSPLMRSHGALKRNAASGPPAVPYRHAPLPAEGESSIADLMEFLRLHGRTLAACTLLGVLGGYLWARSQRPMYRASATIEIQDLNENFLNLKEVASSAPPVSAANDLQTQLRILQSRNLVARVLGKVGPDQSRFAVPPAVPPSTDEEVEAASRALVVRETRQSRIVDLTYESYNPNYAPAFVNALAQQYIDQTIESRLEISRGISAWLEKQLEEMRGKLAESENKLHAYSRQSGLLVTTQENRPDEDKLRQVQEALSKAQENRMAKQARLDMALKAPLESLEAPLGSALKDHQAKLADLRRQRADLVAVYTPDFAPVKRLDAQIKALESSIRGESESLLQAIRNDFFDAEKRERLLENSYEQQVGRVSAQAGVAIQYGILKREADSNRELYNTMLQRTAAAKVASALRASSARVVDVAKKPLQPFRPNKMIGILSGATAGLLAGLVLVAARGRRSHRVASGAQLATHLHVPELGAIPESTVPVPEAYRSILTSILYSPLAPATPQVIVVTSAVSGEGKSTLVSNLAWTLSQMKRTVLMIDASSNRGLHYIFGQHPEYGLRDVLELGGADADLLPYVTHPTRLPGASLAAIGPADTSALDLTYTEGLEDLIARMRRSYDLILIDTPAILEQPDARVFGKMADGVVLVVRAGDTTLETAGLAAERLQWDGTFLLGSVLNRV